jgi:aminopeptidase-like protein
MKDLLEKYFDKLWPICRSITGDGVRETLSILQEIAPIEIKEVPSGKKVFDWNVPQEWNVRSAYIITPTGEKIADLHVNNLHLVSYSEPVDTTMDWEELKGHLHFNSELPDAIPYVTSYYKKRWGFCISKNEYDRLPKSGSYKVFIDSELKDGSMTYGEIILPGPTQEEIFFSTYVCHPSMANNELSGPLVQALLYQKIAALPHRKYTYRFVFIPETIGAIAYLSEHGMTMKERVKAGYVITCVGDAGDFHYKKSRRGNSLADKAVIHYLSQQPHPFHLRDYRPDGSDERQYCSPGFNLPVGSLMRTPYYEYPYYHTSLDNKSFIDFEKMAASVEAYAHVAAILELNEVYYNQIMFCEPQLGSRGMYPSSLTHDSSRAYIDRVLHLLNYSDGEHDLIDIANIFGADLLSFREALAACIEKNLLALQPSSNS